MSEPLRLYDIEIDGYREPVQADLDAYSALGRAYGRIREAFTRGKPLRPVIAEAHAELMADIKPPPAPAYMPGTRRPIWTCGHEHASRGEAVRCLEQQAQQGRYARDVLAVAGAIPIGIVTKRYLVEDPVTAPDGYKVGDIIEYREPVPFG